MKASHDDQSLKKTRHTVKSDASHLKYHIHDNARQGRGGGVRKYRRETMSTIRAENQPRGRERKAGEKKKGLAEIILQYILRRSKQDSSIKSSQERRERT